MSETPPSPHAATSAANPTPATPVRAAERRRRQIGWRTSDVLRAAAAVAGMYLVLRLIGIAQTVFLTAFLGVLFGLAVSAGVDWLRTRVRAPRGLLAALIVLGSAGAIVGFFVVSGPVLATQSRELPDKASRGDRQDRSVGSEQGISGLVDWSRSGSSTTAPGPAPQPVQGPATPAERPTGAAPRQVPTDSALAAAGAKTGASTASPPQTLKQRNLSSSRDSRDTCSGSCHRPSRCLPDWC